MSSLCALTIIVAGPDPARFHAALSLAAANAALDRPTRVFLQAEAVALLQAPVGMPSDTPYGAVGLPTLAELLDEARALGVTVTACQSGLALCGMAATGLPDGILVEGLISVLADDATLLIA